MERLPKEYWKISFISEEQETDWTIAYQELEPGYRWQIDSTLNYLVYYKQPWKKYPKIKCDECRDGVYLLDVSHSGIGNKTVQIMIWFDEQNHVLVPLDCEIL